MKQILVVAEIFEGEIRPITYELVTAARQLAMFDTGQKRQKGKAINTIKIVVIEREPEPFAQLIAQKTGLNVIGLKLSGFKFYTNDIYIDCLDQISQKVDTSHILIGHTAQGRDFAPGLAVRLKAAAISGVSSIESGDQGIVYLRPVLNNTKHMIVRPEPGYPVILNIMSGRFKPYNGEGNGVVTITTVSRCLAQEERIVHQKTLKKPDANPALKAAKVIIAAGKGISVQKNLDMIFAFSKLFPDSAVGVSRPLVDMGWIGYEYQVGITGAIISPELYVACGISGSSQHLAGMTGAKMVVSINKNPDAPIFRHSDFCIVEDVVEFIQAFREYARNVKKKL